MADPGPACWKGESRSRPTTASRRSVTSSVEPRWMKVLHTCSDHLQHTPGYLLEIRTKVREDFTITVKALVGAFSVIMSLRFMLSQCSVPSHFVMENIAIYLLPPAAPSWSPSASPASAPWPGPAVWRSKVTVW